MQRGTPRETDRRRPLRADGIGSTPAVSRRTLTVDKRTRTVRPLPREIPFPSSLGARRGRSQTRRATRPALRLEEDLARDEVGVGTLYRLTREGSKTQKKVC